MMVIFLSQSQIMVSVHSARSQFQSQPQFLNSSMTQVAQSTSWHNAGMQQMPRNMLSRTCHGNRIERLHCILVGVDAVPACTMQAGCV